MTSFSSLSPSPSSSSSPNQSLIKILGWSALSTAVKFGQGVVVLKLLAVQLGPEGLGRVSNIMFLSWALDLLSGLAIFNGINKYVAEFRDDPQRLQSLLGTASAMILSVSTVVALVLLIATRRVSHWLGAPGEYLWLIKSIAIIQFAIAGANLLPAMLKGAGDATGSSLSAMGGYLLGLIAFWLAIQHFGYRGAQLGLALMPAWSLIPTSIIFYRRIRLPIQWLKPTWNPPLARSLLRFSVMTFTSTLLGWKSFCMVRDLLTNYDGWVEVGLWEAMHKFSENYVQIVTTFLSVYLLPLLSYTQHKPAIVRTIVRTLRFILPIAVGSGLLLWVLRDGLIRQQFSPEFGALRDLCIWQLSADVFRIGSAVFRSFILSKALLPFYLLSELILFLLTLIFSHQFVPTQGVLGALQAHLATHSIYFILCLSVGAYYARRIRLKDLV
ncbi:lipid III flippase WzxE [unidentified bacterial endosymbiont]|uniref:lipid III flippase WzxE n=1 Tax=unidentified bacterial endosymbiont TaxID=2355 RepID=UPI00209CB957|nr:lipid III flippase WzxE [unidentified bacterial endosymbiont]